MKYSITSLILATAFISSSAFAEVSTEAQLKEESATTGRCELHFVKFPRRVGNIDATRGDCESMSSYNGFDLSKAVWSPK